MIAIGNSTISQNTSFISEYVSDQLKMKFTKSILSYINQSSGGSDYV